MSSRESFFMALGFILGSGFAFLGFLFSSTHDHYKYAQELKAQCEQDLPRSQECVMTYVRGTE